ncbi:MAG: hypothetical protein ACOYMA_18575 [Bacteroidia bacterium]
MATKLKHYHKILPLLIIPICLLLVVVFGWSCFATLSKKGGLNGDANMYYNLSMFQYSTHTFTVASFALGIAALQIVFSLAKKPFYLTKTFWIFAVFIVLVIFCEIYLMTIFVAKG